MATIRVLGAREREVADGYEVGTRRRPPKKKGRIANDVAETGARSAMMPMPTTDTTYRR